MRSLSVFPVIAAALATAALSYLGTGLHPIWWMLWLAPVPVLAIAPRLSTSAAFLLGSGAWLLGELNEWNYVRYEIEAPWHIVILYFVIPAAIFGLGVLLVRSFLRRGWLFLATLAFPVYWVTCEYLNAIASPHSTWGNLAYTQMNFLPVIQVASVTGLWGISFIVFLFAGTIAALLSGIGNPRQRGALAVTIGIVVCPFFLFGEWRLRSNPSAESVAATIPADMKFNETI